MKKIIHIIVTALMIGACTYQEFSPAEWAPQPYLELDKSGMLLSYREQEIILDISTNYDNLLYESKADWCTAYVVDRRLHIIVEMNDNYAQRETIVSVAISKGRIYLQRDIFIVQTGGGWDMVDDVKVFWHSSVTDTQKQVISQMIRNMVYVRGGDFVMGLDHDAETVKVTDFYISKYEVTQAEWNTIMGGNDSYYKGPDLPVTNMTAEQVFKFIARLNEMCLGTFFLPTETEWEYAAKGGVYSKGYVYAGGDDYNLVGNHVSQQLSEDDPRWTTVPVGQYLPNELGLYDMSGNVAEMCYDFYSDTFTHVSKGGSFEYGPIKIIDNGPWMPNRGYGIRLTFIR